MGTLAREIRNKPEHQPPSDVPAAMIRRADERDIDRVATAATERAAAAYGKTVARRTPTRPNPPSGFGAIEN